MIKLFQLIFFVLVTTETQILFCMSSGQNELPELFQKISRTIKGGVLSSTQPLVDQSLTHHNAPSIQIMYKKQPLNNSYCQEVTKSLANLQLEGLKNTQGDGIIWRIDITPLIELTKKICSTKTEEEVLDFKKKYEEEKKFREEACMANHTKNDTIQKLEQNIQNLRTEINSCNDALTKQEASVIQDLHTNLSRGSVSLKKELGQVGSLFTKESIQAKILEGVKTLEKNNNELNTSNYRKNWAIFSLGLTSVVLGGIVTYQNVPFVRALFKQS